MRKLLEGQRNFYNSNKTKDIAFRKKSLRRLQIAITKNEPLIYEALKRDLNKCEAESYLTEVQIVQAEIKSALKHMESWQRPQKVKTPLSHFPATSYVYHEPYGVVLILSPWNYPFQLALAPLVGAVAAGNCVMLKVSKSSDAVSRVVEKIIKEAFFTNHVCCLERGIDYDEIVNQKYDFIFFTGSENVGKKVMAAASKYVTPVVLELGGKSPCIIEKTADIKLAAKRLAWGKYLNAGQTCVAPDYVLVDKSIKEIFLKELQKYSKKMYGEALQNEAYPKIINQHHFERLTLLIDRETDKIGGGRDESKRRIEPTIFVNTKFEDEIMKEEIFGPILPIISYDNLDVVIKKLKMKPKSLAFYIFSRDQKLIEKILKTVEFGGGCVNDVIMHLANHYLPFGGLGSSGMGNYHGKYSFATFTHEKSVLKTRGFIDICLRYPPYSKKQLALLRKITH